MYKQLNILLLYHGICNLKTTVYTLSFLDNIVIDITFLWQYLNNSHLQIMIENMYKLYIKLLKTI